MSSDYLLAIKADRNTCEPYAGPGWIGHVVRVSLDADMTIVNEFEDGGTFEHEDCAPASLQSWFIDKGMVKTTIREIEELAGTNLNGTGFTGIIAAGDHFGLEIKFSGDNPTPGYIMNPGGFTKVVGISEFPAYLAATQGGCLVLPNIQPVPPPPPHPSPPPPDEVYPMFLWTGGTRPAGAGADPRGNGAVYLCDGTRANPGHFKRWFAGLVASALPEYVQKYGELQSAEGAELFVLDRMIELPAITNDYVVATGFTTRPLATPDPAQ